MKEKLFADFEPQTAATWETKLINDLKGKPLTDLLWKNHGLEGKPFYTKEDLPESLPDLSNIHNNPEAFGNRYWVNYQTIAVDNEIQSNDDALKALENGANGLIFQLKTLPHFETLLKDIKAQYCSISFESEELQTNSLFEAYLLFLKNIGADLNQVSGFINGNGVHFQTESAGIKTCVISANQKVVETPSQIAVQLATLIDLIDREGLGPEKAFNCLAFNTSLTNDYFGEIAKHRAIRQSTTQLGNVYGIENPEVTLFSSSQDWNLDIEDKHSLMLYATTQAMAAIVGGTDALSIKPFYSVFKGNQPLAERMARNISNILKEESYLDKNTDPAAGSYYIETTTSQLVQKTFEVLKEIESKGGLNKVNIESFVESKPAIQ